MQTLASFKEGNIHKVEQTAKQIGSLHKVLGAAFSIAVTVGGTVGPGVLRSPGLVAGFVSSPALIVGLWVIGGIYALLGTMMMAELAAALPEAGGLYIYAREAFGQAAGVTIGWSDLTATCAAAAAVAVTGSDFAAALYPQLAGKESLFAVLVILLFAFIQWQGVRISGAAQEWAGFLQAAILIGLLVCCFALGGGNQTAPAVSLPPASPWAMISGSFLAMRFIIMDYDGWYSAIYFSEENENPGGNMPRSMILGVVVILITYVLLNAGFLYVMPAGQLAGSKLAAADVAQRLFGPWGARLATFISLLLATTVIYPMILMNSRLVYSLARAGLFWSKATAVNSRGTPTIGLITTTGLIVLFTATGTFERLSAIGSFMFVVNYASCFIAVIALRRRGIHKPPWSAWGYPWSPVAVILASAAYLIGVAVNDLLNSAIALAFLLGTYPLYLLLKKEPSK